MWKKQTRVKLVLLVLDKAKVARFIHADQNVYSWNHCCRVASKCTLYNATNFIQGLT